MSGDVATLGLRLDANGFLTGSRQVTGALFGMGQSATATEGKVRQFATQGSVAIGSLAASGTRDLTGLMRSMSGLAFALGPIAGTISLAVIGIGTAFMDARKTSKQEQDRMLADFRSFESKFGEIQLGIRIATLEAQRDAIADRISARPERSIRNMVVDAFTLGGRNIEDYWKDMFATGRDTEAMEALNTRIGGLRTQLAGNVRATAAKQAEEDAKDLAKATREAYEEQDRLWKLLQKDLPPGASSTLMAMLSRNLRALSVGEGTSNTIRIGIGSYTPPPLTFAQGNRPWHERMFDGFTYEQMGAGALGMVGGFAQGLGGPLGGAASGVLAGVGGGPFGMAMGGVQGLVSSLMNLGSSSSQAREAIQQFIESNQAFIDQLMVGAGVLSETEAGRMGRERTLAQKERELRGSLGLYGAGFDPSDPFGQAGITSLFSKEFLEEIARQLKAIDMYGEPWIDAITKHTEALNTATRNNPAGFNLGEYGVASAPRVRPMGDGGWGGRTPGTNRGNRGGADFSGATFNFVMPAGTVDEQMRALQRRLKQWAAATNGPGSSVSEAWDMIS